MKRLIHKIRCWYMTYFINKDINRIIKEMIDEDQKKSKEAQET